MAVLLICFFRMLHSPSLPSLAPNWTTLIDLIVAVKGFLMATSYLIVVGDNVPDGIKSIIGIEAFPGWLNFRYVISIGVVAVIPLVCQRNFSILRYSSTVVSYELPSSYRVLRLHHNRDSVSYSRLFHPHSLDSRVCVLHYYYGTPVCIWGI